MQLRRAQRPGCLRTAARIGLLVVVAPWAALVHLWRRLRRGDDRSVRWTFLDVPNPACTGDEWWCLDLRIDVPAVLEARTRTDLIDTLIRMAEALRCPDDLYNLVVRLRWDDEPRLAAVGRSLQQLAERLERSLSHRDAERCTHLWLTLPRSRPLGSLTDRLQFDPEKENALGLAVAATDPRWAAASSFGRFPASVVYRVIVTAPGTPDRLVPVLERLRRRVESEPRPLSE